MEILRNYEQIVEKTKNALGIDVSNIAMLDLLPDEYLKQLSGVVDVSQDESKIIDLAMLIFQLNNFMPALLNYTKIFLQTKNFYAVLVFISKCYSSHLGGNLYVSQNKSYNATERLFDRFVELMREFDVDKNTYLPLVMDCIFNHKSQVFVWADIALEFMKNYLAECGDEIEQLFEQSGDYAFEFVSLVLEFNTQKGMFILFNNSIKNADFFVKKYVDDACLFFEKHYKEDENKKLFFVKTLALAIENQNVVKKLNNVLAQEQNADVKQFLNEKLKGFEVVEKITIQQYKSKAAKNVMQPQQRTLGVAFENLPLKFADGTIANETEKTYLIDVFKDNKETTSLRMLVWLFEVFEKESLSGFAKKIFYKVSTFNDILQAKWAVRMVCLLCIDSFENLLQQFLQCLKQKQRNKEARYIESCLQCVDVK